MNENKSSEVDILLLNFEKIPVQILRVNSFRNCLCQRSIVEVNNFEPFCKFGSPDDCPKTFTGMVFRDSSAVLGILKKIDEHIKD